MQRFWWVNHNQTGRQEVGGEYLWSPKRDRNNFRNQAYDNMRLASPGDLVLSYFGQALRYIGRVTDFAFTAPQPPEFGSAGANWSKFGWRLPVYWTQLASPLRPRAFFEELRPLLPAKNGPLNKLGDGSQKTYLAELSRPAFEVAARGASFDMEALARGGGNRLTFEALAEDLDEEVARQIEGNADLSTTQRESLVQARRGQGRFRINVQAIEPSCRLTGVTNPLLLIASHIKPWRLCSSSDERLDGMNGLLLTPDADHLFDRGFISFEDDGEVKVSTRVDKADLRRLGFEQLAVEHWGVAEAPAAWRTRDFAQRQCGYLDYHRREVFIA